MGFASLAPRAARKTARPGGQTRNAAPSTATRIEEGGRQYRRTDTVIGWMSNVVHESPPGRGIDRIGENTMNIEDLTIGEARKVAQMFGGASTEAHSHGWSIVVADRGFVYVGNVTTSSDWCVVKNAGNIRRWGTTNGLAQLATTGPTNNTVIDWFDDVVKFPMRAVISIIAAGEPWKR